MLQSMYHYCTVSAAMPLLGRHPQPCALELHACMGILGSIERTDVISHAVAVYFKYVESIVVSINSPKQVATPFNSFDHAFNGQRNRSFTVAQA